MCGWKELWSVIRKGVCFLVDVDMDMVLEGGALAV